MLPFYLAAAALVLIAGMVLASVARRGRTDIRIESAHVRGSPTHEDRRPAGGAPRDERFTASGSWVLSALPDCVRQRWEHRYLSARSVVMPVDARRVAPGSTLPAGPCAIAVSAKRVVIARGSDRFEVPPVATLYTYRGGFLLRRDAGGRVEVRAYYLAP